MHDFYILKKNGCYKYIDLLYNVVLQMNIPKLTLIATPESA